MGRDSPLPPINSHNMRTNKMSQSLLVLFAVLMVQVVQSKHLTKKVSCKTIDYQEEQITIMSCKWCGIKQNEPTHIMLECPTPKKGDSHINGVMHLLQSLDDTGKCTEDKITQNGLIGTQLGNCVIKSAWIIY